MKKTISIILILVFAVLCVLYLRSILFDKLDQNRHSKEIVGIYQFDINQTRLLDSYVKDSLRYNGLKIQFYKDHTFKLSLDVPFIDESSGIWVASGSDIEELSQMYFRTGNKLAKFELYTILSQILVL